MDGELVRVGPFVLDQSARELRTAGATVRLQDQPFLILQLLVRRAGQVVTRDEMKRALWPEGTHVDFEHSLNAAIKRLRAALGDDADTPRFIETVPRRGYRLLIPGASLDSGTQVPRLAVLPLSNLSGNAADDYLADGFTEELIGELGQRFRGRLAVIARWSSMRLKSTSRSATEIGGILAARYLIEGSVRRAGNRARIAVALLDAKTDVQLWTDVYECEVTSPLEIQAAVARRTADALELQLLGSESPVRHRPKDEAYHLYLKGRYHWNLAAGAGMDRALALFRQAHLVDADWAEPLAAIARTEIVRAEYYVDTPRKLLERARAALSAAERDSRQLPDVWLAKGEIARMADWNWKAAREAYQVGIQLNPSLEDGYRMSSLLMAAACRPERAIEDALRACHLDPLCILVHANAAWVLFLARQFDAAITKCDDVLDLDPAHKWALRIRAVASLQLGEVHDAYRDAERAVGGAAEDLLSTAVRVQAVASVDAQAARHMLEALTNREAHAVPHYEVALACLAAGEIDRAFAHLDRAAADRDPLVGFLVCDPRWSPVSGDSRYLRLARDLRLSGASVAA